MVIIGLDPGIATIGYAIIKKEAHALADIACNCIKTPAHLDISLRLLQIEEALGAILKKYTPDLAAIEQLYFAKNTKTALTVAHARGVILATLAASGIAIKEYNPLQVKQAICGYGRAEKMQLQKMVQIILRLPSLPKPDDAADALAVAICCAHHLAS